MVFWLLPTLSLPWLVGIVSLWRLRPRDGWIPPSAGDRARERLTAG
jgi:hypothetical protein